MVTDGIGFAVCASNEVGRVRRLEALGRYIELASAFRIILICTV